jgi:hypothetical protein
METMNTSVGSMWVNSLPFCRLVLAISSWWRCCLTYVSIFLWYHPTLHRRSLLFARLTYQYHQLTRIDQWNKRWPRRLWVFGFDLCLAAFLTSNFIDATIALLVYDYFLTLDSEIERFWKGRFYQGLNWASFLFFANRYLALLGYTPLALELSKQTDKDLPVRNSFEFNPHFWWLRLLYRGGYINHLFALVRHWWFIT